MLKNYYKQVLLYIIREVYPRYSENRKLINTANKTTRVLIAYFRYLHRITIFTTQNIHPECILKYLVEFNGVMLLPFAWLINDKITRGAIDLLVRTSYFTTSHTVPGATPHRMCSLS